MQRCDGVLGRAGDLLDRDNAALIGQLLADLNSDGLTVVVPTHDMALAQAHAHRVIRMEYGRFVGETGGGA